MARGKEIHANLLVIFIYYLNNNENVLLLLLLLMFLLLLLLPQHGLHRSYCRQTDNHILHINFNLSPLIPNTFKLSRLMEGCQKNAVLSVKQNTGRVRLIPI